MEGRLIALFATLTVFVASGVQGTSHLSFSNDRQVNITRDGCGSHKICLDDPTDCDPSTNGTCLFVSLLTPNSTNLTVDLRGNVPSPGYVAMGTTLTDGSTSLFVCAHNGSANATFFRTLSRNNGSNMFMPAETRVTGIRVMLKGDVIRCGFDIQGVSLNQNRISIGTNPNITAGSGNVTANGGIGQFIATLNQRVNLTSAAASNGAHGTQKQLYV
ncbi:putative ferric-chelate reductase 1 [Larimichthys crocea]|uniref:putative ferric-chelate reductase 1 n=1 Tax=Larimichthys crocea TaxID=215358 RepID=UPI000F5E9F48|nr:putative ferric-chelate reductase 1 [Larimichthys crocea]